MKKIYYILLPVLFLQLPVSAQPWKLIDTAVNANFIRTHFWNGNNGIVHVMNGFFLKTHDGGASWDTVQVPFLGNWGYMQDMKFIDDKHGFACGGSGFSPIQNVLIGTSDGGQTWDSLIVNLPSVYEFSGLDFTLTSAIKGIVFTTGNLYKTLDSGKTLTAVNLPVTGFAFYIHDAVLVDNTIVLAGNTGWGTHNKIYVSSDWGANWVNVFDDTLEITALGANGHTVYAGCSSGWVIKSDNGGNSWTTKKVAANAMNFNNVKFGANDYVYLTANNSANNNSYVYGSDNDGASWHSQVVDGNHWMVDVSIPSKDTGYALAYGRIYKTTTGGGLNLIVSDLTNTNDIQLYPNPAHHRLVIEVPQGAKIKSIQVYDITGKMVRTEPGNTMQIDVSSLTRGDYIIKIETDKCTTVKKLLVQ